MFRPMRRFRQQLSNEECEQILRDATSGVLALQGDDGYPYAVPVSHVYENGKIYFHGAKTGHKIDSIRRSGKVSFCVIAQDEVMAKERTTAYISVIAFGRARIVEDHDRAIDISRRLSYKFTNDEKYIEYEVVKSGARVLVFELIPEHMTGKIVNEK